MTDNSSFSSNDCNPNVSLFCFQIHPYSIILPTIAFTINLFLLPLFIFILHHGLQQWRKKSSSMSHSDCFTYNMVLMELVQIVGQLIFYCGSFLNDNVMIYWGAYMTVWVSKLSLHLLTCVERYLAVVHPITYMRLKNSKGIRIRNVSIVCAWMFSGAVKPQAQRFIQCILAISIAAVSFFSLSVLLVLVRPGPGEQGGNRKWADPSKKRAFFTIAAILGVLVLKLSGNFSYQIGLNLSSNFDCMVEVFLTWLELPNNLILPVLFLLRHERSNK